MRRPSITASGSAVSGRNSKIIAVCVGTEVSAFPKARKVGFWVMLWSSADFRLTPSLTAASQRLRAASDADPTPILQPLISLRFSRSQAAAIGNVRPSRYLRLITLLVLKTCRAVLRPGFETLG